MLFRSGKSLLNPTSDNWAVKKDGGTFDQFTGATITPRAVVRAVKKALLFFNMHKDLLLTSRLVEPTSAASTSLNNKERDAK